MIPGQKKTCQFSFKFEADLEEHKLKAHSEKAIQTVINVLEAETQGNDNSTSMCEDCDYKAESKAMLEDHIENVNKDYLACRIQKEKKRW